MGFSRERDGFPRGESMARKSQPRVEKKIIKPPVEMAPDARPLGPLQAARLAAATGVAEKELVGKTPAALADTLRWRIDPIWFGFRQICGRVVKRDPVTGTEYPVHYATVHVEDTDCSFLGYFPPEWPWGWLYPFNCRREDIAVTVTDACGRFCVWVPIWDIDWILRWRRERVCFPIILVKPTIWDLLQHIRIWPPIIHPIGPDPPPWEVPVGVAELTSRRAVDLLGAQTVHALVTTQMNAAVGAKMTEQQNVLSAAAFSPSLAAALPAGIKRLLEPKGARETAPLAEHLKLASLDREQLAALQCIGPFFRCWDVFVPEWFPILDAPDITVRVTQDVNGDGTQETIYSEGFFDVRWNAGYIPDVTLEASQIALAAPACDTPDTLCGEGAPFLQFVGLMPLSTAPSPAYIDAASGYALRPNRPHPNGLYVDPMPSFPAQTPYSRTLQLYGCNHATGAVYYRLRYSFDGSTPVPFTGLTWPVFRFVGGVLQTMWVTADSSGWYPILNPADGWFPDHLLLNWPTAQDGLYNVDVQLGDAGKAVLETSPGTGFRVDNSAPYALFTGLAWRVAGTTVWTVLDLHCPVLVRPAGQAIEFRISYLGSAAHLRSLRLSAWGCDGDAPLTEAAPTWSDPPSTVNPYEHWSTDPVLDNAVARTAIYSLSGAAPAGAYRFHLEVDSRSFNPAGGDGGFQANWYYDPVYNWTDAEFAVAVVDG